LFKAEFDSKEEIDLKRVAPVKDIAIFGIKGF